VVGWTPGRTHVHSKVSSVLLAAYEELKRSAPGKVFVYGETGWKSGGLFKPHKTHQNGLSVDLMVPVLLQGESVPLPGSMLNRYGYGIEFDNEGKFGEYLIDFEALGELVYQIDRAAKTNDLAIARVIFDVALQHHLWATSRGSYLKQSVGFSKQAAWVRHDEHIHVDFAAPCDRM